MFPRTHTSILENAEQATPAKAHKGMSDVPVIALLPEVDISNAFPGQRQHSVCLGTVKRLTKPATRSSVKAFGIRDKIGDIERKFLAINQ
jgi:hypothetical protein